VRCGQVHCTREVPAGGKLCYEGSPWNSNTASLIAVGKAHCHCALLGNFFDELDRAVAVHGLGLHERAALSRLGQLWGVQLVQSRLGEFILCGALPTHEVCHCCEPLLLLFSDNLYFLFRFMLDVAFDQT
jgi:hypothetical protein